MLDSIIVGNGLGCWLRVPRQSSKAPEVDFIADADSAGLLPTLIYPDEADGIAGAEFAIPIESYSMHARVSRRQKTISDNGRISWTPATKDRPGRRVKA